MCLIVLCLVCLICTLGLSHLSTESMLVVMITFGTDALVVDTDLLQQWTALVWAIEACR